MTMHENDPDRNAKLGPLLIAVAQSWRRVLSQDLINDGLSDATALPLSILYREGDGLRQNELAEKLGLEGTSVVRVLDSLERDGYVRRQEDERDRRAKRIFLTDSGRVLAERTLAIFASVRAELLHGVDPLDIEATERLLVAMSDTLAKRQSRRKP